MMGVLPVRIGEILQHILGKCILQACGEGVAHACDVEQLCSGLWGGIEGGVHATTSLWADHQEDVGYGVLLLDTWNAFNDINQTAMLWNVQHTWSAGTGFGFNTYQHWKVLVLRGSTGTVHTKEEAAQGDALVMILYGLGVLSIISTAPCYDLV